MGTDSNLGTGQAIAKAKERTKMTKEAEYEFMEEWIPRLKKEGVRITVMWNEG